MSVNGVIEQRDSLLNLSSCSLFLLSSLTASQDSIVDELMKNSEHMRVLFDLLQSTLELVSRFKADSHQLIITPAVEGNQPKDHAPIQQTLANNIKIAFLCLICSKTTYIQMFLYIFFGKLKIF